MPAGNKQGPEGMGPMSGRGMGYCSGNNVPGYEMPGGRGRGLPFGAGARRQQEWRHNNAFQHPSHSPDARDEISQLRSENQMLKKQMDEINRKIDELRK
ncbi:MAG: DUF5320 domain-containing protein [Bacteroidota bacterium]